MPRAAQRRAVAVALAVCGIAGALAVFLPYATYNHETWSLWTAGSDMFARLTLFAFVIAIAAGVLGKTGVPALAAFIAAFVGALLAHSDLGGAGGVEYGIGRYAMFGAALIGAVVATIGLVRETRTS